MDSTKIRDLDVVCSVYGEDELAEHLEATLQKQAKQVVDYMGVHGAGIIIVGAAGFKHAAYGATKIEPGLALCGGKSIINVGAIGHVDMGKTTLIKAIDDALRYAPVAGRTNKSDRKRDRANRWG